MFLPISRKLFAILVMKTNVVYHLFLFFLFLPALGSAQYLLVTGSIVNAKTGVALENVNIFEAVTGIGTITNISGYFSLMLKPGNMEFVVTHEGFSDFKNKMALKNDTTLKISLVPLLNIKLRTKETELQKTAHKLNTLEKLE